MILLQHVFEDLVERDRDIRKFTIANADEDVTYLAGFAQALDRADPVEAAVRNGFAAVGTGHHDDDVPILADIVADLDGTSFASSSAPRRKTGPTI